MGNKPPKTANHPNPKLAHLHKRTLTESELYNFRDKNDD